MPVQYKTLEMYREVDSGVVYVLAGRDKHGVHLRDLDSEPRDPEGIVTMGEWEFWVAGMRGRMEQILFNGSCNAHP